MQPFLLLHLDIFPDAVHTIEDALHLFSAPEALEGYRASAGKVSNWKVICSFWWDFLLLWWLRLTVLDMEPVNITISETWIVWLVGSCYIHLYVSYNLLCIWDETATYTIQRSSTDAWKIGFMILFDLWMHWCILFSHKNWIRFLQVVLIHVSWTFSVSHKDTLDFLIVSLFETWPN